MINHLFRPVPVLICCCCLWGLSWLPLRALNALGIDGLLLVLISHLILALIFTAYSVFSAKVKGFVSQKNIQQHVKPLLGIMLAGGGAIVCFTYAMMYGNVIRVMVLFYLLPVWGVLGGHIFLKEHVDNPRKLGVLLAVLGAFLLLGHIHIFQVAPSFIDLIALASGFLFAVNNIIFRQVERVPLAIKLTSMFYGCTFIAIVCLLIGIETLPAQLSNKAIFWTLIYTFAWLLLANIGSQWAVTQMEAGRSSILIIVELFAAVISALLIAGERLSLIEWVGCTMVVAAAFIEAIRQDKVEE